MTASEWQPTPPADAPRPGGASPDSSRRKGVFDPARVRFLSFAVISLGLFTTALLCVLAIWDYASRDTAWRSLSTLGVLCATMLIFNVINEMFGARMEA